ncbi:MAG: hypothetical protein IJS83_04165 [Acholeplasmatales bacterium]|nr:hypothetical protein [Acholeplasmatales bacterium]
MKQKKDRLKDYIKSYLINHNDEFKELLSYKNLKKNSQSYKFLTNRLYVLRFILDAKFVDKILCDQFTEAYRLEDFETCYEVLTYIYKYYFIEIDLNYVDYPEKLNRRFLVPFRNTIGDLITSIVVLIRASGNHLANITFANKELITAAENVDGLLEFKDTVDYANNYQVYDLINSGKAKFYYDYADGYEFTLKIRKSIPIDDNLCMSNLILVEANGYGIYEDNRIILNDYCKNPNAFNNYERKLIKDMIPFNFEEVDVDSLILKFESEYRRINELYSFDDKKEVQ